MAALSRSSSCPALKNVFRIPVVTNRRCANCNGKGHNRRTCIRDWGVVTCPPATPPKKTAAVKAAKPFKQVSLIGVSMFNEPKEFYKKPAAVKQVSLLGVTCFKEPKEFYKKPVAAGGKQVSLLGVTCFNEPKEFYKKQKKTKKTKAPKKSPKMLKFVQQQRAKWQVEPGNTLSAAEKRAADSLASLLD